MLPTMSSEAKRKFQKNVTSPMTGIQRLKRLPAEGWFLLAASFPLAAIFTWNVTVPLLTGSFGKNPVEVLQNFFNGFSDLDKRLTTCPTILTKEAKRFFEHGSMLKFREEKLEEDFFTLQIKEPLIIRRENSGQSITDCDKLIEVPVINEISHWIDEKIVSFDRIRKYFQKPTEDMCIGGKFDVSSVSELKQILPDLEKMNSLKNNFHAEGYIGTRYTERVLSNFYSCSPIVIIQVCGKSLFKVRSLVKDPGRKIIRWSQLYTSSLLPGDMMVIPSLSIVTGRTETVVGSFFNLSLVNRPPEDMERKTQDQKQYTILQEATDIFNDLNINNEKIKSLDCLEHA